MPIKFRCQHCRQFLGISRGKAGAVVDCPKCGRSIRVPDLDGNVKPLPKPGLNLKDSDLRDALSELANIGQVVQVPQSLVDDDADLDAKPAKPEMIELQPVAQAKPIDMPMPKVNVPAPKEVDEDRGWRTTRQADDAWKAVLELGEGDSSDEPVVSPDPSTAPQPNDQIVPTRGTAKSSATSSRLNNPSFIVAAVGIVALIFTVGFWIGRVTAIRSESSANTDAANAQVNSATGHMVGAAPVANASLRGRITYRTETGDRKPDKGARVIVLPSNYSGKTKLKLDGFRASDSAQDQRVAKATIQAMGGDFAITDDAGNYSATLSSAGQFHVVVLSNSLSRPETEDIKSIESLVGQYFERPTQLIGRVSAHTESVRYSGQETAPWDHSFQRD